jgi:methylated-DNA-[protein]-cysteine S-methyltransferase
MTRYTIFRTKWGYFGLAGSESGLLRTCLPLADPEKVKTRLLIGLQAARCDKDLFQTAQERITAYFEGAYVNFDKDIPILLDGFSRFARSVLTACRDVRFGRTISYGELAAKAGSPKAARAIGGVMARNPLPLIIPCHRVVRSDGKIGGFSAAGGVKLKKRMLELEGKAVTRDPWPVGKMNLVDGSWGFG